VNGWNEAVNRSETCVVFRRDIEVAANNAQLIMAICFAVLLVLVLGLLGYTVYKNQKRAKQVTAVHLPASARTHSDGLSFDILFGGSRVGWQTAAEAVRKSRMLLLSDLCEGQATIPKALPSAGRLQPRMWPADHYFLHVL
jgi:hypothetical protein